MLLSLVPSFPIIYAENSTALNIIININKLLKRSQHSLCSNYIVRLWSKIYYCSVIKSSPTLCDPMDCSPPGSFAMGLGKNFLLYCLCPFGQVKLQYFGQLMRRPDSFEKTLMLGKIEGRRRRG